MQVSDIKWLHAEVTSKCNAWCPACARNNKGFGLADGLVEQDLSTIVFETTLKQLPNLYGVQLCGNLGDPIAAANILDIIKISKIYCKKIQIHTNGSLRSKKWWRALATLLKDVDHDVWFGIDGLEGVHEIYRQGTNYKKIIENATAFIDNGGHATWQFIPYAHNEHQIKECIKESQRLKFKNFKLARLHRKVINVRHYKTGKEFKLGPPNKTFKLLKVTGEQKNSLSVPESDCMHMNMPSIYLSATGLLSRCCYLHNETFDNVNSLLYNDVNLSALACLSNCA